MAEDRIIPTPGPSDNPTFTIFSDGEEISELFSVVSVMVLKEVNRIPYAKVVLFDGDVAAEDFPASTAEEFQPGKEIEIKAGYQSEEESIFTGVIIRQSIKIGKQGSPRLCLELKDVSVKMTIGRKNGYFFDATDSDTIEDIIGTYSIDADVEATDVTHTEMVQYYTTDWDFVVSRAEKNGKVVIPNDGAIEVKAPDLGPDPVLNVVLGDSIIAFEAEVDAENQYGAISSNSWNYTDQELAQTDGEEPDVEKQGQVTGSDLAAVIDLDSFVLQHSGQAIDEELQAWADAKMLKSRLAKIQGRVRFNGFAGIKPGDVLEITGVGDNFNGKVYVSAVRHEIKDNWETDVQFGMREEWFSNKDHIADTAAAGLVPAISGLQIGIVSQIEEDPDGEDRILVRMPIMDSSEDGIWARVASLDAGDSRGAFFRPEVEDEVILGFVNADPRDPVVLGMLNSSAKPAPFESSDDNHEKGFVTRSEMKLVFNDDENSILIETPGGNMMSLSEDEGGITIEDENGNKLVMSSDGIEMESAGDLTLKASGDINIEGVNVAVAADAEFTAEGTGGAGISSSAMTTVEGSIVMIN